jgi:hypothetical protein
MDLLQHVRFAVRLLIRDRVILVAVGAFARGDVNNAVFTIGNAGLIRGVPFKEAIASWRSAPAIANVDVSFLDVENWRRSAWSRPDLVLFGQPMLNISDAGRPRERDADAVSSAIMFSAGSAMRPAALHGAFDGD